MCVTAKSNRLQLVNQKFQPFSIFCPHTLTNISSSSDAQILDLQKLLNTFLSFRQMCANFKKCISGSHALTITSGESFDRFSCLGKVIVMDILIYYCDILLAEIYNYTFNFCHVLMSAH